MKQHISHKQWNELSKEGKEKFLAWSEKHHRNYPYEPKLEIGQMIEFLTENDRPITIVKRSQWHGGLWDVNATGDIKNLTLGEMEKAMKHRENVELIDALWEIVKEVLEPNNIDN